MAANDSLLFIDANIYLDLYEVYQEKPAIFDQLKTLSRDIFVTQQVVEEVRRR